MTTSDDYFHSEGPCPHIGRRRMILAEFPQVRALFGRNIATVGWIFCLVALQLGSGWLAAHLAWPWVVVTAWLAGAFVSHGLYVLLHECSHNLVTGSTLADRWLGITCDVGLAIPGAQAFRKYHLLHHQHLGDAVLDPDIVSPREADLVGRSWPRKMVWLSLLWLSQALRPAKGGASALLDRWVIINTLAIFAIDGVVLALWGPKALAYLALSTIFALGLHPLGGRWLQEHYVTAEGQETYSYYGVLNRINFNIGLHNEHHDFPNIPWNRLPKLSAMAAPHYTGLKSYRSWTAVVLNFIFDRRMSGYSRIIRPKDYAPMAARAAVAAAEPPRAVALAPKAAS